MHRGVGSGFRCAEILALPPASCGNLEQQLLKLLWTSVSADHEVEVNLYFLKLLGEVNMIMSESTFSLLPSCLGNSYSCISHHFTNTTISRKPFQMATLADVSWPPCCIQWQHHELSLCKYTSSTEIMCSFVDHLLMSLSFIETISSMRRGSVCGALAPSTEPGTRKKTISKHLLNERKVFTSYVLARAKGSLNESLVLCYVLLFLQDESCPEEAYSVMKVKDNCKRNYPTL